MSSLHNSPSVRNLSGLYDEKGNAYPQWSATNSPFASQCVKQENQSLDMGYNVDVKLNSNEVGDFRHSAALPEVSILRSPPTLDSTFR